jgi:hypothetical protein
MAVADDQNTINLLLESHLESISREFRSSMAEIRASQDRLERDLAKDIKGVAKDLKDSQDRAERDTVARLERIEIQTKMTNGRVSELEKWEIEQKAKETVRKSDKTWVQPVITGFVQAVLVAVTIAILVDIGVI